MKIGFLGFLQALLIVAKMVGFIAASWWVVFIPMYISFVIGILIVILAVLAAR